MKILVALSVFALFFGGMALSDSHGAHCEDAKEVDHECCVRDVAEEEGKEYSDKEKECEKPVVGNELVCPVMENTFTIEEDTPRLVQEDAIYYFCCGSCVEKFKSETDEE